MDPATLQGGGGILGAAGGAVALAASLILVMMVVALGAFAYKSLRGGGIEWPEDREPDSEDGEVHRGNDDDEWDYY
jgi:hypothetical protein